MTNRRSTEDEVAEELIKCLKDTYEPFIRYATCKKELEEKGYIIQENGFDRVRVFKEVF
ncbi:MAG: hypothetical protein ACLFNW_09255 [Desulfobacterales bacterium]